MPRRKLAMLQICKCETPPSHYSDFDEEFVGEDQHAAEVSLFRCRTCGRSWLKYLIEEPHRSNSGRWWRVAVSPEDLAGLSVGTARDFIEKQLQCIVGGSYFGSTGLRYFHPVKIS